MAVQLLLCFFGLRGFEPVRDEGLICPAQKGRDLAENGKFFLRENEEKVSQIWLSMLESVFNSDAITKFGYLDLNRHIIRS